MQRGQKAFVSQIPQACVPLEGEKGVLRGAWRRGLEPHHLGRPGHLGVPLSGAPNLETNTNCFFLGRSRRVFKKTLTNSEKAFFGDKNIC